MKAVVYNGVKDISLNDIASPDLGPGQIMIDVEACGICGSDLHLYRQGWSPELATVAYEEGRVPGHEFAGVIAQTSNGVEGMAVGDRVVALGMGAMAEQVTAYGVPGVVVKIPENVSFDEAATAEPMSNSLRIVRKSDPKDGENVVVFGLGIIGLGVVQAYQALGIKLNKLIVVDTSDFRLGMAEQVGADFMLNPKNCNVHEEVLKLCGTRPNLFGPDRPAIDVVCDCVGFIKGFPGKPVIQQALDMICPITGRIMCFGIFEDKVELDLHSLIFSQPKIIGVMGMELEDFSDALELMASGKINRKLLITHTYPIEQCKEAFEAQAQYADSVKVIIHP